jgi:endo-1,4-beta-xylanase
MPLSGAQNKINKLKITIMKKVLLTNYEEKGKIRNILIAFLIIFSAQLNAQTVQTDVPALKDVYVNDFTIGCLLSYKHVGFSDDGPVPGQSAIVAPNGGNLIKFHMNCMSPGNNMKPQYTVDIAASAAAYSAASAGAVRDSINTHPIIKFNGDLIAQLNWVEKQGFTFRGHTLVWHNQTPAEFFRSGYTSNGAILTKEVMTERLDNYIHEVIRLIHESWPGLLSAMDVVNEAIDDNTGNVRTTGNNWYTAFGDTTYIMKAFELTRKYTVQYNETQMKLYYNDYNTHSANKADGIVKLCRPIFEAGYLDGIGMQEHDALSSPTAEDWIASYNKFDDVCSEMAVTELDVTTGGASPSANVLANQANQYGQLFKCFVERSYKSGRGKIINVSKDGLNDQYTFKTNQSSSLWDSQNQCKPSFYAVVDVGNNYNSLDSLIAEAELLEENDYPAEAWANFITALNTADEVMSQNYSVSESAADALEDAFDNLVTAIYGLTNPVNIENVTFKEDNINSFAYVNNNMIYINNIPEGAKVNIFSFNGVLLWSDTNIIDCFSIPYSIPCIVRIQSLNEVVIIKIVR